MIKYYKIDLLFSFLFVGVASALIPLGTWDCNSLRRVKYGPIETLKIYLGDSLGDQNDPF